MKSFIAAFLIVFSAGSGFAQDTCVDVFRNQFQMQPAPSSRLGRLAQWFKRTHSQYVARKLKDFADPSQLIGQTVRLPEIGGFPFIIEQIRREGNGFILQVRRDSKLETLFLDSNLKIKPAFYGVWAAKVGANRPAPNFLGQMVSVSVYRDRFNQAINQTVQDHFATVQGQLIFQDGLRFQLRKLDGEIVSLDVNTVPTPTFTEQGLIRVNRGEWPDLPITGDVFPEQAVANPRIKNLHSTVPSLRWDAGNRIVYTYEFNGRKYFVTRNRNNEFGPNWDVLEITDRIVAGPNEVVVQPWGSWGPTQQR